MSRAVADRVNPIVVKELRQAVRSRLVVAVLLIFLSVCVVTIGLFVMLDPNIATRSRAGAELFAILMTALALTCQLVVPLYTCVRFSRERNDDNVDLLFITTIRPGAIIRGKFSASMALTGLIFASCLPFLCLTYLLRGIDLPTIFFLLAWTFLNSAVLSMFSVMLGSFRGGLFVQILVWLVSLAVGIITSSAMISISARGGFRLLNVLDTPENMAIAGTVLMVYMCFIGLFYVMGVSSLSPASSNRSMLLRIYLTAMGIVVGVVIGLWSLHEKSLTPVTVWTCISVGFACTALFIAIGERDGWTPRVRKHIPQNRPLRMAAWLFYTGSSGGVAWCTFIAGVSIASAGLWGKYHWDEFSGASDLREELWTMGGIFMYALCCCLLAVLVRHFLFKKTQLLFMPLIAVGVAILWMFGPMLAAYFIMGDRWNVDPIPRGFLLSSPLGLFDPLSAPPKHMDSLLTVGISTVVLCLASLPWFIAQWTRFRPLEKIVAPAAQELAPAEPART
jgi:hypothetical protein